MTDFDKYQTMFESAGWMIFMQDLQSAYDSLSYDSCNDMETFFKMKGRREQLRLILNMETMMAHAKEMAKDLEVQDDSI